jgi:hypothetical protein
LAIPYFNAYAGPPVVAVIARTELPDEQVRVTISYDTDTNRNYVVEY